MAMVERRMRGCSRKPELGKGIVRHIVMRRAEDEVSG